MSQSNLDTPFELKFLAETGVFEGYASVFNVTDSVNDRIVAGAFKSSLEKFRAAGRLPPLLWQHNGAEPIGIWREMFEDSHGLFVKGELFVGDIPLAKEAYKLLKESVVTGLSIGYRTKQSHRDQKSGVRILTEVELLEVSLVTFPANEHARVLGVKKFFDAENIPTEREFESFLHNAGFSRRQAKGVVAKGYRALAMARPEAENLEENFEAWARFRASLVQATEDNKKAALEMAFPAEKKNGGLTGELYLLSACMRQATADNLKYDHNQPRAPRGQSDGGQWTDGGGGGSRPARRPSSERQPLAAARSAPRSFWRNPLSREELDHFNRQAPSEASPEDLEIHPDFGLPRWYVDGGTRSTFSEEDAVAVGAVGVLKPVATEAVGAAVAARNAVRLRGYLSEARKIPKGVREVGTGTEKLTAGQLKSLKSFKGKNTKVKNDIKVTNFSDGSTVYSAKIPARDIPGSYSVYEKYVDATGNVIRTNKTTVGPKGEFVHTKPK